MIQQELEATPHR